MPKAVVSWSSGKDCAFALHQVRTEGRVEVVGLLTTLNEENDRIAMHGVRKELLQMQLKALDLPAEMVMLPMPCDDESYRQRVGLAVERLRERGVQQVVFGDLFLEDIRQYREEQMQGSGLDPVFPLWQRDTGQLCRDMVNSGLQAVVTCVDQRVLSAEYLGRRYDHQFLDDLPADIDPCGENGEFHTLVTAGPMFSQPIAVQIGEKIFRDDFAFIDVRPVGD
ncbi:MAG: adenine nucleotide alpha hydrolase [Desulfuromonadales bacterium]|nr:adenine nucleotide alpha hydrolase [Desulfuromonadales bacterium]